MSLWDLGLDALTAQQLCEWIKDNLDTPLNSTVLLEYASIEKLSSYLIKCDKSSDVKGLTESSVRECILESTSRILSKELQLEEGEFNDDTPLWDLGLDSFSSTELMNSLSEQFGVRLSATLLFSFPTIALLADHLTSILSSSVESTPSNNSIQAIRNVLKDSSASEIGIVGISCRFPGGVETPESFWDLLRSGRCTTTKIPLDRWDADAEVHQFVNMDEKSKKCLMWGSFLDNLAMFDPAFFGISASEATSLDPQQRLLLEMTYLTFLDAGYSKDQLVGRNIGVFVGVSPSEVENDFKTVYSINATDHPTTAGRISFVFGLQGPCAAYSAACASSLVALHAAVRSLQYHECELAIVLGVTTYISAKTAYVRTLTKMLSHTGRCHTFDESADGYLRGEGCAGVLLQRMDTNEHSNNGIYAIVKGAGVAQDGKSASLTAPNGQAQEKLLRATLRDANLSGKDLNYLEAHGTGTPLRDPIEIRAATTVLTEGRPATCPLIVGAAKANIGHLLACSGMVGIIKAILIMYHEEAPPNSALKNMNPKILEVVQGKPIVFPVEVQSIRQLQPDSVDKALFIGISAFDFAGTIAHAILGQAPEIYRNPPSRYPLY